MIRSSLLSSLANLYALLYYIRNKITIFSLSRHIYNILMSRFSKKL